LAQAVANAFHDLLNRSELFAQIGMMSSFVECRGSLKIPGFAFLLASLVCMQVLMASEGTKGGLRTKCQDSPMLVHTSADMHSLAQAIQSLSNGSLSVRGILNPSTEFARLRPPRAFIPAEAPNARGAHVRLRGPAHDNSHPTIRLGEQNRAGRSIPQLANLNRNSRGTVMRGPNNEQRQLGLTKLEPIISEMKSRLTTFDGIRSGSEAFALLPGDGNRLTKQEEQRLSQSVQKEISWLAKREEVSTQLGRPVSDEEFASELGLHGGAMEYRREVSRMHKDKNLFISSNLGLVIWQAKKYRNQGMEIDDLIQEGIFGLTNAIHMFDPARGNKFSTMAVPWIRLFISRAVKNQKSNIRVPLEMQYSISKMRKQRAIFYQLNGRYATEEELAQNMNISMRRLTSILRAEKIRILPFDAPLSDREEKGRPFTLEAVLGDRRMQQPEDLVDAEEVQRILDGVISASLTDEESLVLRMRYGLMAGPRKPAKIAEELNMTRREVGNALTRAKRKLRKQEELSQYDRDA